LLGGAGLEGVPPLVDQCVGHIRRGGAVLDGEAQAQTESIDREAEAEQLIERIPEASGQHLRDCRAAAHVREHVAAYESRSAAALSRVDTGQRKVRAHGVADLLDLQVVDVQILHGRLQVRPQGERLFHQGLAVECACVSRRSGCLGEHDRELPQIRVEVGADLPPQRLVLLQYLVAGLRNVGLRLNKLQLGLIYIELGNSAQLELPLGALEELVGQIESAFLNTQVLAKLNCLPVGQFRG